MIELDQALEALRAVVARKGEDYVYDGARDEMGGCVYQYDGQPQCIVGHVLAELLPEKWLELEIVAFNEAADVVNDDDAPLSLTAARALRAAQVQQDKSMTWGHALRRAEECARAQA